MLTPGIYYPNRNAHRQLLHTLPGKDIYPVDSGYIHYTDGLVSYVNFASYAIGETVGIYVNGVSVGTTTILNSDGLYVYELHLGYGVSKIESHFPDGQIASQTFYTVNLYTLLSAEADVWSERRRTNILLLANQYLTPPASGIFRGQVDQEWMSKTFGAAIGFPQPHDWPFDRYALAMGGAPTLGLPSIYGAITKGSSTGAIKDIVQAVTGYEMTDEDMRGMQWTGWQLGRGVSGTQRYRYSGLPYDPVADTDPTGVSGPHYFLPYNQYSATLLEAALTPANATIIGGANPIQELPEAGYSGWPNTRFADGLTIDGQRFNETGIDDITALLIVRSGYAHMDQVAIAAGIQAAIRNVGNTQVDVITGQPLGDGFKLATCVYDAVHDRYVLHSGTFGANGLMEVHGEGWHPSGGFPGYDLYVKLSVEKRTSYIPGQNMEATVVGGLVPAAGATGITYAAQISIDGQSLDGPFFLPGPFTTGAQVATAMQADIRRLGSNALLGAGWTSCLVTYHTNGTNINRYEFHSGTVGTNSTVDSWVEGWTGTGSPLLGEGYRLSYTPGITMFVSVNGTYISTDRYYFATDAVTGVTTVWIRGVKKYDHISISYTNAYGAPASFTGTVGDITGASPTAVLQSNIQQAYTMMLNIVHDGFFVDGETVLRSSVATDYLAYNWLNPWATNPHYVVPALEWQHETTVMGVTPDAVIPTGHTAQPGSEFVSINGAALYPSGYTYTGPQEITIGATLNAGDTVQVDYRVAGQTQSAYEVEQTVPGLFVATLPDTPMAYGMTVFVNGGRVQTPDYFLVGNEVTIPLPISVGDKVCIRYYTAGLNSYGELNYTGIKQEFFFDSIIDPASVMIFVNGERVPANAYTCPDDYTVRLADYIVAELTETDVTTVTADIGMPTDYSVMIQQGAVDYVQGINFAVDYTHGKILWIDGAPSPVAGSAYSVYYTYFPKQILEQLLGIVKPSTIKLLLQFTTTGGNVFTPYYWDGQDNPSGDVIIP
jgi:hypothetical protein